MQTSRPVCGSRLAPGPDWSNRGDSWPRSALLVEESALLLLGWDTEVTSALGSSLPPVLMMPVGKSREKPLVAVDVSAALLSLADELAGMFELSVGW